MKSLRSGFTLIEVTIAMALIVLAFGGLMSVFLLSEDVKVAVKYDLIAQNLAKEGLELVRFKRDKNYNDAYPAPVDGFTGIYDNTGTPYLFTIDSSLTVTAMPPGTTVQTSPFLKIFQSAYGYSSDPAAVTTVFKRLITTTYDSGGTPPSLKVQVQVLWQADSKQKVLTVEEELTDWH